MVHAHAREDGGTPAHEVNRIRATYDAIRERVPEILGRWPATPDKAREILAEGRIK